MLRWCWWQFYVRDFMIVTVLRCWWQKYHFQEFWIRTIFLVLVPLTMLKIGHQYSKIVTNTNSLQNPSPKSVMTIRNSQISYIFERSSMFMVSNRLIYIITSYWQITPGYSPVSHPRKLKFRKIFWMSFPVFANKGQCSVIFWNYPVFANFDKWTDDFKSIQ